MVALPIERPERYGRGVGYDAFQEALSTQETLEGFASAIGLPELARVVALEHDLEAENRRAIVKMYQKHKRRHDLDD